MSILCIEHNLLLGGKTLSKKYTIKHIPFNEKASNVKITSHSFICAQLFMIKTVHLLGFVASQLCWMLKLAKKTIKV